MPGIEISWSDPISDFNELLKQKSFRIANTDAKNAALDNNLQKMVNAGEKKDEAKSLMRCSNYQRNMHRLQFSYWWMSLASHSHWLQWHGWSINCTIFLNRHWRLNSIPRLPELYTAKYVPIQLLAPNETNLHSSMTKRLAASQRFNCTRWHFIEFRWHKNYW